MGKKGKPRSERNKAKAKQRSKQLPGGPTSVNDLPDEILDAVFLNLGSSPLHLIRGAATCRRWRRAIAGAGFLDRCHALHGAPPVAGCYHGSYRLLPNATGRRGWCRTAKKPVAFVPSSSPAVVDAGHFSLDFLYVPPLPVDEGDRARRMYYYYNFFRSRRIRHSRSREIVDSRGSLLLLTSAPWWESTDPNRLTRWSPDFIVCEPVSRRYQGIARPADVSRLRLLGAFLLDGHGGGGDAMSNYRVLSVLLERSRSRYHFFTPRACVFTPGSDGGWHIGGHTTMDDDDDVQGPVWIHQLNFS